MQVWPVLHRGCQQEREERMQAHTVQIWRAGQLLQLQLVLLSLFPIV